MKKNKQSLDVSEKLYNKIYKIADELIVPSPVAIKKIDKYYNLIGRENQKIVDVMRDYAKKYPKLTFSEIFSKDDVYLYHLENERILKRNFKNEKK